jgi:PKD repeat protein/plastocyanin
VSGSPFPYSAASSTSINISVLGNNAAHAIQVSDSQIPTCSAASNVTTPNCITTPPTCALTLSAAVSGACTANNTVPVTLVVGRNTTGAGSFNVFLDGTLVSGSPFPYSAASSTSINISVLGNNAAHAIQVNDSQIPTCSASSNVTTPNCITTPPTCALTLNAAVSGACAANNTVPVTLVVGRNTTGAGSFNVFLDGTLVSGSPFPYSAASSTSINISVLGNNAAHAIQVNDSQIPTCSAASNVTTPNCITTPPTCALTLSAAVSGACAANNTVPVTLIVGRNTTGAGSFNVFLDGSLVSGSPFPYSAASSTSINISVLGNNAAHAIQVSDSQIPTCSATTSITTPDCNLPCQISDLQVNASTPQVHIIEVRDYTFFPENIEVFVGDTVRFVWVSTIPHSTTSNAISGISAWNSGIIGIGSVYDLIVQATGAQPYYCINHGGPNIGMTGNIVGKMPCNGGIAQIPVSFTVTNGSNLGYKVFVDGVLQAGSPFIYSTTNGTVNFILDIVGDGNLHTLTIQDAETNFCAYTSTFTAPNCGVQCGIAVNAQQNIPCNDDMEVGYLLSVMAANQGNQGFNVILDGNLYNSSPYDYGAASSTSAQIFVPADGQIHLVEVIDADSIACVSSVLLSVPNCMNTNNCMIDVDYNIDLFTLSVEFHAEAASNTTYYWDFGDGTSSTEHSITHQYALEGNYIACLIAQTADGCIDTICFNLTLERIRCNADFTWTNDGLEVVFANNSDANSPISGYSWNFGDNSGSTIKNPVHTFQQPGFYNVCLTINADSCSNSYCTSLDLSDPCLVVNAEYDYTQPTDPQIVQFTDMTIGNPDQWLWGFGDGTTSFEQNPLHTYTNPGAYNVCLTVGNTSLGCYAPPECRTLFINVVNTNEIFEHKNILVYPNPIDIAQKSIFVEGIKSIDLGKNLSFTLRNLQGQIISKSTIFSQNKSEILLPENIVSGVYFIEIMGKTSIYKAKIVVFN